MILRNSKIIVLVLAAAMASTSMAESQKDKLQTRSGKASEALIQLVTAPDKSAPTSLLKSATCIAVIPQVVKGGFIFGATYGRGLVSCRDGNKWGAPAFLMLSGGSYGFQVGIDSIDLVLVFIRPTALNVVSQGNFTLGVNASIAAGPVGRDLRAGVDYKLNSDIYSYSRARGIFAGVAFEGTLMKPDESANELLYTKVTTKQILTTSGDLAPIEAQSFVSALTANVPKVD
jgi:lipid-binding SYLF domain-containing protein